MLLACSTPSLQAGSKVVAGMHPPGPECENLGTVIGNGGGSFGGGWISNDQLSQYAINDARNKAAALGANYMEVTTPQLGTGGLSTTTATEMGIAYKCPPSALPHPDAGTRASAKH